MKLNFLSFLILLLIGCDEIGANKYHHMPGGNKIRFNEGDVLVYSSDSKTEEYKIFKVVNGEYSDSRSGTCGKPRFDIYDYQVVYLKPVDSVQKWYNLITEKQDDCQRYPKLNESRLIQSISGSFNEETGDRIRWLDEFEDAILNSTNNYKTLTIQNKTFKDVFEYKFNNGKRLDKIYYTRSSGFVGYQLKDGSLFVLTN
jgi:hypothetical protein